ncbi:MAG TPA: condensation domain-containing protein, partial [Vicinamibacteria bacterium]|nr:condensation domain-containing protein [Vicinamibacteria bacterium]
MVLAGFAISPEQRRTWLQQEADGGGATYRAECVLALDGVARDRLSQALAEAVRRHEILRTRFERVQGLLLPVQVVEAPAAEIPLEVLTGPGDEEAVLRAAFDTLRAPSGGPALRAAWVDGPARSLLCLSLPALCADAGTLRVLAQELVAATASVASTPDEAPLQYADVAAWLNELLESARLA